MRTLSVITPVYKPVASYLHEAYESLKAQTLPDGWDWEWVVQEDGDTGVAVEILPADARVRHGMGRHGGVALTRNLALARARGELVKNLDHDDVLSPGVLDRDVTVLQSSNEIQWTTSRVLDLLPDGSTAGFGADPQPGRLEPGFVVDHWRSHNYRLPVHPTTICIERRLATALGGWMAVPGSDDTGLLVAASVISVGYFHHDVGLFYRKWAGQISASTEHTDATEWRLRMSLIDERARSLASLWPANRDAVSDR